MQIDLSQAEFHEALPILRTIEAAGYEAYFVGGSVRDALLGLPIHDVDIASSAYPAEIKQLFHRTVDTGIQHGTVMILDHGHGYEVTTFRTESGYQDFRRPDHVTFVRSLREDLKRRDFTINALAVNQDGTVIDLFDGLTDLTRKQLRAVGDPHERFHEDALRMMRAVRFESQLGFTVEPATQAAIKANAPLLAKIAVERTANEFTRLLLGIARPNGLHTMLDTGLTQYVPLFAEQQAGITQLAALPERQLTSAAVAWTLVSVCLALPVNRLLRAWKQANALIDEVSRAVPVVQAALATSQALRDPATLPNWILYRAGADAVATAAVALRYLAPTADATQLPARYEALPLHDKKQLALTGVDLMHQGFAAGPLLGKTLHQLEVRVVSGELVNDQATLLAAARRLATD